MFSTVGVWQRSVVEYLKIVSSKQNDVKFPSFHTVISTIRFNFFYVPLKSFGFLNGSIFKYVEYLLLNWSFFFFLFKCETNSCADVNVCLCPYFHFCMKYIDLHQMRMNVNAKYLLSTPNRLQMSFKLRDAAAFLALLSFCALAFFFTRKMQLSSVFFFFFSEPKEHP